MGRKAAAAQAGEAITMCVHASRYVQSSQAYFGLARFTVLSCALVWTTCHAAGRVCSLSCSRKVLTPLSVKLTTTSPPSVMLQLDIHV